MRTIVAILAVLVFIWRVIKLIIQIKEAISDSKDNQELE
jgi:hypothetical protein